MKKMKLSTWIAIGCVALAIVATQAYNVMKNRKPEEKPTAIVTETFPYPPSPIATPAAESVKATPAPTAAAAEEAAASEPEAAVVNAIVETRTVASTLDFFLPSSGEVSAPYSDTELVFFEPLDEWRCHLGMDFQPAESDAVLAAADGTVEKIYEDHLYGTTVCIDHGNGLKSYYGSLASAAVSEGSSVAAGTEIGKMGETAVAETGKHLHFSMEKDGRAIDPLGAK